MLPNFDPTWARTHDLQIMTVHFMSDCLIWVLYSTQMRTWCHPDLNSWPSDPAPSCLYSRWKGQIGLILIAFQMYIVIIKHDLERTIYSTSLFHTMYLFNKSCKYKLCYTSFTCTMSTGKAWRTGTNNFNLFFSISPFFFISCVSSLSFNNPPLFEVFF